MNSGIFAWWVGRFWVFYWYLAKRIVLTNDKKMTHIEIVCQIYTFPPEILLYRFFWFTGKISMQVVSH